MAAHTFSNARLRMWSWLVRLRDGPVCPMCEEVVSLWRKATHHIYPKSEYPEKAYDLDNGISLCVRCHIVVVHGSNTFGLGAWRYHVRSMLAFVRRAKARRFNEANQKAIAGTRAERKEAREWRRRNVEKIAA